MYDEFVIKIKKLDENTKVTNFYLNFSNDPNNVDFVFPLEDTKHEVTHTFYPDTIYGNKSSIDLFGCTIENNAPLGGGQIIVNNATSYTELRNSNRELRGRNKKLMKSNTKLMNSKEKLQN